MPDEEGARTQTRGDKLTRREVAGGKALRQKQGGWLKNGKRLCWGEEQFTKKMLIVVSFPILL